MTGRLVHAAAVRGHLSPIDDVELVDIAVDVHSDDDQERNVSRSHVTRRVSRSDPGRPPTP